MKLLPLLLLSICVVSCASTDGEAIKQAARNGDIPDAFQSYDAAVDYANSLFAGGCVDRVQLGSASYFVLIQHGSGRPVLGIAVYQKKFWRWERVPVDRPPVFDFVRASAAGGKIILTEDRSKRIWTLYDPEENG